MSCTDQPIVVQKYGGSSVADTSRLRRVAERIVATRKAGKQVVVVVSAMAATTDELLARAKELSTSPSRRELDMLLSCGERASMALLAMAVHELGIEAVSLTGSQSGIMTNDRHSGARIIEVRPIRVADELARDRVVIVAGFQGVSYKREITTLGRGGSDTTAVALAAALGAEYCEICSDVDGIYTADPRVVDAARMLDAISCDEMLELAAHGAKVLHAGCVEIARRTDIALYARATAKHGGGTRIDAVGAGSDVDAVGVTGQKQLVRLRSNGSAGSEQLLRLAADEHLAALHLDSDTTSAELWFALADVPDWPAVRERLLAQQIDILEGLGAVSVVGDGLGSDARKILQVTGLARDSGVDVVALSTSPLRVSLFCCEEDIDSLIGVLHAALIEKTR